MNQFAIFYLLTLTVFYVSFAPANGKPNAVCKLQWAKYDHNVATKGVDTFNTGKVNLYSVKKYSGDPQLYTIGDGSKKYSEEFSIHISNTIIFGNKVEITWYSWKEEYYRYITITPDEDTFEFARRFFLVDNFTDQHKFLVTGMSQNGIGLENVTTIKAKQAEGIIPCWVFIALDRNNKPLIFFSTKVFDLPRKQGSKVLISLTTKPQTPITIEFANSAGADQFYAFVSKFFPTEE